VASIAAACAGAGSTSSAAPAVTAKPTAAIATTAAVAATAAPTAQPEPKPVKAMFDGVPATSLSLGRDDAPIDVAFAFGSIWTADHHQNRVTRIDPATMAVQARVDVGSGPGWFVVADDGLWVSNQLGRGLSRIDAVSNTSTVRAGDWATCWRGAFAFGAIWQPACDAHQLMRIDPTANHATDVDFGDRQSVVLAGDKLITGGPDGLSRLDPASQTFTEIGGPAGAVMGFDGRAVWLLDDAHVLRVNPSNGNTLASFDTPAEIGLGFRDDHALLSIAGQLSEIDLATSKAVRTIKLGFQPFAVLDAAGYVWLTNFDGNSLIRLEL